MSEPNAIAILKFSSYPGPIKVNGTVIEKFFSSRTVIEIGALPPLRISFGKLIKSGAFAIDSAATGKGFSGATN